MYVTPGPGLLHVTCGTSSGGGQAGWLRALEPLPWVPQFGGGRQGDGGRPHAVQPLDAGERGHLVRPLLPLLVLAQLHVEAEQALDDPLWRRSRRAAAVHGGPQLLVARDEL